MMSLVSIYEPTIANVCFYLCLQLRIMNVKKNSLTNKFLSLKIPVNVKILSMKFEA